MKLPGTDYYRKRKQCIITTDYTPGPGGSGISTMCNLSMLNGWFDMAQSGKHLKVRGRLSI